MGSRFCKSCGAEITEDRPGSCPKCGAAPSTSDIKNPVLAAVLSLIIPGLGQSYNGNALKGIGIFLGLIILWIINLLMYSEALFIGIIGILILWIIGVYDAYRDAGQMNRGEIPEKKHQMLLFGGVAVVVVIVLAAIMFLLFCLMLQFVPGNAISLHRKIGWTFVIYMFVGAVEGLFFYNVARKYVPTAPSTLVNSIIDQLKKW